MTSMGAYNKINTFKPTEIEYQLNENETIFGYIDKNKKELKLYVE